MIKSICLALVICAAALGTQSPVRAETAPPAPRTDVGAQSGTLSDKLNQNDGVIHPEGNVDAGMQKPAPQTGKMPIVPPPGSPGGDTTVDPK